MTNTSEAFRVALDALRANRLRSALTMLGVVIGVAAVVLMVAIGSGAKQEVEQQVEGLGSNIILVTPNRGILGSPGTGSDLTLDDVDLLGRVAGDDRRVAVSVASGEEVGAGARETFLSVNGVNENVPNVFTLPMARGQYITSADVETRHRVAVLGVTVVHRLFGDVDPLGRQVSIAGVRFRVIGVFAKIGTSFGLDRDTEVHIPVTAAQQLFGVDRIDGLAVKAPRAEDVEPLRHRLVGALRDKYAGARFSSITQTEILGTVGRILALLTLVLAAIAAISLLVGGVGVSNIMLVSVRERTQEIGLRKALGARERAILLQFLIEAVLLCVVGGVIGVGLGVGGSLLVSAVSPLPTVISWWSPVVAFAVSAAVGIFFGVAPARRAARLDPVVALRSE
jgi:putative ABC transport system permease protein